MFLMICINMVTSQLLMMKQKKDAAGGHSVNMVF